jgi:suppressor for copper-sensitivity B
MKTITLFTVSPHSRTLLSTILLLRGLCAVTRPYSFRHFILALSFFVSLTLGLFAPFFMAQAAHVEVLQSTQSIGKEKSFWVGLKFTLDKGEKILSGAVAPKITLINALNVKSLRLYLPPEETDHSQGIETQVFKGDLLIPVKVYLKNPGQAVILSGELDYVACSQACTPAQLPLKVEVKAGPLVKMPNEKEIKKAYYQITHKEAVPFINIILLAFLGGLILNLMPCVLPVLGLKFLAVMSSKKHKMPRVGFLMTILGILTSFWGLASLSILLKQAGLQVGWGMHFQEPLFLGLMIFTMLLFSLNLLGAFEIHLPHAVNRFIDHLSPKSKNHLLSSYASGVFATLLATPCTAPFLGVSVGFALTQSASDIFLIFTSIALGFAAPYGALILLPAKWIPHPKPGAWMMWIKGGMGVALLATAVWLSTVFYAQIAPTHTVVQSENSFWKPFDPESIPSLVKQGKIVVVNVTAKWCLTCQINERNFHPGHTIYKLLNTPHVHPMQGDWTKRDKFIATFLAVHARSGIPFTMVFGPDAPEGIVLPEILTEGNLTQALKKAGL